jgi:hypothetical protein
MHRRVSVSCKVNFRWPVWASHLRLALNNRLIVRLRSTSISSRTRKTHNASFARARPEKWKPVSFTHLWAPKKKNGFMFCFFLVFFVDVSTVRKLEKCATPNSISALRPINIKPRSRNSSRLRLRNPKNASMRQSSNRFTWLRQSKPGMRAARERMAGVWVFWKHENSLAWLWHFGGLVCVCLCNLETFNQQFCARMRSSKRKVPSYLSWFPSLIRLRFHFTSAARLGRRCARQNRFSLLSRYRASPRFFFFFSEPTLDQFIISSSFPSTGKGAEENSSPAISRHQTIDSQRFYTN